MTLPANRQEGQPNGRQSGRQDRWVDEEDEARLRAFKPLTREEAQALARQHPSVSPWRVVIVQVVAGVVVAGLAGGVWDAPSVFWSALYGAGVVVVPAVLMARGMTSTFSSMNPGVGAVSFMLWEFVKIGVSVAMLMLASRIVVPLSWPALLAGLFVCIKVYWVALAWRGRRQTGV